MKHLSNYQRVNPARYLTALCLGGILGFGISTCSLLPGGDSDGNALLQQGVKQLHMQQQSPSKESYLVMFDQIKQLAEQKPRILDHLGPHARMYLQERYGPSFSQTAYER